MYRYCSLRPLKQYSEKNIFISCFPYGLFRDFSQSQRVVLVTSRRATVLHRSSLKNRIDYTRTYQSRSYQNLFQSVYLRQFSLSVMEQKCTALDAGKGEDSNTLHAHVEEEMKNVSLHDILSASPASRTQTTERGNRGGRSNLRTSGGGIKAQKPKFPQMTFAPYWTRERVSAALKRGEVIEGTLKINIRNFELAYVKPSDESSDILVKGVVHRNRALNGDQVIVELFPKHEWVKKNESVVIVDKSEKLLPAECSSEYFKTGKIVFISELKHNRVAAGHLKPYRNHHFGCALFSPVDSRIPRIIIPLAECPSTFENRPKDYDNTLFMARILEWKDKFAFASGKLVKSLGEAGEIEPETEAYLAENGIIDEPFSSRVLSCLPETPWSIPKEELETRRDLRDECIVSIDPPTAKDLDDALSIKKHPDGNFEIGVHIADVSYFVKEGTLLDVAAKQRGTSVYLVQKVVPMLPSLLCEELCSLNPGVDRLAFSVIWSISPDGDVLSEWFGKSVIQSCCKLSYNHAQQIIDSNEPGNLLSVEFPEIFGGHDLQKVAENIQDLQRIAAKLREKRYKNGALRLDQPKLSFIVNDDTGLPSGCANYEYKESNKLIEEFMLLANIAVAHKILTGNKDKALLRRHPEPDHTALEELSKLCLQHNIILDVTSSKGLHQSIENLKHQNVEKSKAQEILSIIMLSAKAMKLAKYFCSGALENEMLYRHYALNVPIYTHFTSPIRRYADVIVHRLLKATIYPGKVVNKSINEMQCIAEHCNDKKLAAKRVQELSLELFFNVYVRECGPLSDNGYVVGILDSAFDVISSRFGVVKRIYCNSLGLKNWKYSSEGGMPKLTLRWIMKTDGEEAEQTSQHQKENEDGYGIQILTHFSPVDFDVTTDKGQKKVQFVLHGPQKE